MQTIRSKFFAVFVFAGIFTTSCRDEVDAPESTPGTSVVTQAALTPEEAQSQGKANQNANERNPHHKTKEDRGFPPLPEVNADGRDVGPLDSNEDSSESSAESVNEIADESNRRTIEEAGAQ